MVAGEQTRRASTEGQMSIETTIDVGMIGGLVTLTGSPVRKPKGTKGGK